MTHKEIFEALLAGKKLTYVTSQLKAGERWVTLVGYNLRDQDGRLADGMVIGENWCQWQVYEKPNPHTKGTFPWAREENLRGKKVTANVAESYDVYVSGQLSCRTVAVLLAEIESTNWKVVP